MSTSIVLLTTTFPSGGQHVAAYGPFTHAIATAYAERYEERHENAAPSRDGTTSMVIVVPVVDYPSNLTGQHDGVLSRVEHECDDWHDGECSACCAMTARTCLHVVAVSA